MIYGFQKPRSTVIWRSSLILESRGYSVGLVPAQPNSTILQTLFEGWLQLLEVFLIKWKRAIIAPCMSSSVAVMRRVLDVVNSDS